MVASRAPILAVTGATGFLGSEILRLALRSGWQVRAITRDGQHTFPEDVEVVGCGYEEPEGLSQAFACATVVIHSAGLAHVFGAGSRDEAAFVKGNASTAAQVAQAARSANVPLFVLVSSVSVYGNDSGQMTDETTACSPQGPYARSKFQAEKSVSRILAESATGLIILRMATIYGAGDRGNVSKLIHAISRKRFVWPGNGQNYKSLIHKGDAARACLTVASALPQPELQQIFNVSAPPQTMTAIVEAISAALGRKPPQLRIPEWLLTCASSLLGKVGDPGGLGAKLQKFTRNDAYSAKLLEDTYSFKCEIGVQEGIREQIEAMPELGR